MPAWPRDILPQEVSDFEVPGALMSMGQSGRQQRRSTMQLGRRWTEVYPPFKGQEAAGRKLLATIRAYWRNGTAFDIEHYLHATKLGGGTGSPLVNGGSQTGSTLNTDGWTGSNPVLKAGDLIRVVGINHLLEITSDAPNLAAGATALSIAPPLFSGGSPADNAPITYTAVRLNAYLAEAPVIPPSIADEYVGGLTLVFEEQIT